MSTKASIKVLTVIDSLVAGGAERSLTAVAPALVEHGVEMHVAHLIDRPGLQRELAETGVILHSSESRGSRIAAFRQVSNLIQAINPDLVHTSLFESDVVGRPAAWLRRVPVVSSLVGEQYGPEHLENPKYRRWKVRGAQVADMVTAQIAVRFHAVSESVADLMSRRLRIKRDRIDVIPRGRDPGQLGKRTSERRKVVRESLGLTDGSKLVLGVGRQFYVKGFDIVIDAFSSVVAVAPECQLIIAGREGPATPDLQRQIAGSKLDDSARLAGYRPDVADLMVAADVLVSGSRSEGSPGALIEAMALETPIVASDIPAIRELAGPVNAISTVPLDNPTAMAKAILEVIRDPELASWLANQGYQRFNDGFTVDSVAKATVDFYHRSLS